MEFKTKTQLRQHIAQLTKDGYLKSSEISIRKNGSSESFIQVYTINFDQIKANKRKK